MNVRKLILTVYVHRPAATPEKLEEIIDAVQGVKAVVRAVSPTTSFAPAPHQVNMNTKYTRLRDELRKKIRSGELKGSIGGERTLAKRYKLNAATVSRAIDDLVVEGLLVRKFGIGTFVVEDCNGEDIRHDGEGCVDQQVREVSVSPEPAMGT